MIDVDDIISRIKRLKSGESCIYFKGETIWDEKLPERDVKKLQDFFEKMSSRNYIYFTQRRLSNTRLSDYEYIATKSRRIR